MALRAFASTDSSCQKRSTSPAIPNGAPATVSVARSAVSHVLRSVSRATARRITRSSRPIRTVLMSPSSASAPVEVQALYQTDSTPRCRSSA
jgi:hypothetical protein